ncbi:MAG: heparinase II/III-family protein [Leadbetterella sp.]|nr:heparinase II/III-family protein [Leadbetterella sp.]
MKAILTLLALCLALAAPAQQVQRNILGKKYPEAVFRESLLPVKEWKPYPQTPGEWKQAVRDSVLSLLVKAGEAALKKEMPQASASLLLEYVRSGDRAKYQDVSYARRNNLMDMMLAESIEDKGRFTEAIMNYIWAICEETYWGVPAHLSVQKAGSGLPDAEDPTVDLFAAETAGVLALADYFTGEKLDKISPLLRKRIYSETRRKVFDPLKQAGRYSYLSKTNPVNNWNPWVVSNIVLSALLLEKDETLRTQNAYTYTAFMDSYLNSLGDDGGCDEGPSYWFAAGACVYDVLQLLQSASAGRIDYYDDPLIRNMAAYIYKMHIADDYFVNFADADPKLRPDGLMLFNFGEAIKDPQLMAFGQWAFRKYPHSISISGFHRMRKIHNLLSLPRIHKEKYDFQPVSEAWLKDIQVMTARASNGFYLATHAGHNAESHNHNDVGDFILYYQGEPVIIDAGRGNYTARTFSSRRYELWFTQSEYHNLPVINGFGQVAGRKYEASDVSVIRTEKENTLQMDIAPAYSAKAGVESWKRQVKLNKVKNQVEINDQYVLGQAPASLQQVFMTVCETDLSTPGKIIFKVPGNKPVSLSYDPGRWEVSTDLPSTEGMEYNSFKTKWNKRAVRRILLTARNPAVKGKHGFVISER